MELAFETKTIPCLRETMYETISQEETSEAIVPDSFPDVARILDSFGTVILRAKEYRTGGISVTGGIQAGVIYAPDDGSTPRTLHFYVPFTVKAENDVITEKTKAMVDCHVRSVDARAINSRKVMVRVNLAGTITASEPAELEETDYAPEEGSDLQIRRSTYPVVRTMEMAEKPFAMTEEAELPAGRPFIQELYKYLTDFEVTESKLVGNKGVFKGMVTLKLLYLTAEGDLAIWSCQLPFSQYVELDHEYDGEEELQVLLALTDSSVEDANGQGKRLLVNLQVLAQCAVVGKQTLEVLEDAYSLGHEFTPEWKEVDATGRLDRQNFNETMRSAVQAPVKSVVDTRLYLDTPVQRREGDALVITVPITANTVYLDENGELQQNISRLEASCRTELADGCLCRPTARLTGEAFAVPAGDGMEIRGTITFTVDSMSGKNLRTLSGGQLGDEPIADAERPSVILRPAGPEDCLWSVAKACHTTTEAIRLANGLTEDGARLSGMLLIPVVKK